MIEIRRAVTTDLDSIMGILEDGIFRLGKLGLPQWQNGYGPTVEAVKENIQNKESYVLLLENSIVGSACLQSGIDPVYTAIQNGSWEEGYGEYISIHRFCVDSAYSGRQLGTRFLQLLVEQANELGYQDIRIDTYPENVVMKKVVNHCGFSQRGLVKFPIPSGERIAYQRIIENGN